MPSGLGWAMATLDDGLDVVEFEVSYLSDAPRDLLLAVAAVQDGATFASASWHLEPEERRWQLYRSGCEVTVGVLAFADLFAHQPDVEGQLIFACRDSVNGIAAAIAHGFRVVLDEFGEKGYRRWWPEHQFPTGLLELVESRLA